jgi:branched-chain amino acid transport system substrate-binding protein
VFRDSLGEGQAIPDNVKTAAGKYHPGRAVLFYANDDKSSSDTGALFQQAFADNGINVPTGAVNAFPKVTSDFKDAVTAALATRPDIWAIAAVGAIPAQVMTEARSQGYKGPFLGNNAFNSYGLAAQAGKAGTGAQAASGYFTGADNMANTAFVAAYKARFKDPDGKPLVPDEVAAQAYTSVRLFAAAAARAALTFSDPAADRRRLRDALAVTSIDSPLGAFSFTAQHDARQPVYILAMDGKGGYTLVETLPVQ